MAQEKVDIDDRISGEFMRVGLTSKIKTASLVGAVLVLKTQSSGFEPIEMGLTTSARRTEGRRYAKHMRASATPRSKSIPSGSPVKQNSLSCGGCFCFKDAVIGVRTHENGFDFIISRGFLAYQSSKGKPNVMPPHARVVTP